MNVLFHINENIKWKSVLDNAINVIEACNETGESYEIEVLANGEAVMSLKKQAAANLKIVDKITELSKDGAVFAACRNSLNKFDIDDKDLLELIQIVPSGVMEAVKKQELGYSYIKP